MSRPDDEFGCGLPNVGAAMKRVYGAEASESFATRPMWKDLPASLQRPLPTRKSIPSNY